MALAVLGGTAGTMLGVLVTGGYSAYQGWPWVISPLSVVGGCLGAAVVGVTAGVYPSVRAARLSPTKALAST
ncbi:ABC-type antimicrobial peptide transport system permease subunit [Streptomyces ambofaciens]